MGGLGRLCGEGVVCVGVRKLPTHDAITEKIYAVDAIFSSVIVFMFVGGFCVSFLGGLAS